MYVSLKGHVIGSSLGERQSNSLSFQLFVPLPFYLPGPYTLSCQKGDRTGHVDPVSEVTDVTNCSRSI